MSDKNDVQTGKTNSRYRSYAEATRETIKYSMGFLQECVGGTQNPEVPGRDQRTVFPISTGLSHMMSVMGAVLQSDRLYNNSHIYLSPRRMYVHERAVTPWNINT